MVLNNRLSDYYWIHVDFPGAQNVSWQIIVLLLPKFVLLKTVLSQKRSKQIS